MTTNPERRLEGILHSDRWGVYNIVASRQRQICWAHMPRESQALSARKTRAGPVGAWGLREIKRLFAIWHRYQAGELTWAEMRWELVPVRIRLGRLLRKGTSCGDIKAEAMCRNLLQLWPALLTFAFMPGVEPTNNRAERALRGAVLWRKGCFGNQSDNGLRFTERILTTVATLKQQDRNIVEYVVAASKAHRISQLAPSLLPWTPLPFIGSLNSYKFTSKKRDQKKPCAIILYSLVPIRKVLNALAPLAGRKSG